MEIGRFIEYFNWIKCILHALNLFKQSYFTILKTQYPPESGGRQFLFENSVLFHFQLRQWVSYLNSRRRVENRIQRRVFQNNSNEKVRYETLYLWRMKCGITNKSYIYWNIMGGKPKLNAINFLVILYPIG